MGLSWHELCYIAGAVLCSYQPTSILPRFWRADAVTDGFLQEHGASQYPLNRQWNRHKIRPVRVNVHLNIRQYIGVDQGKIVWRQLWSIILSCGVAKMPAMVCSGIHIPGFWWRVLRSCTVPVRPLSYLHLLNLYLTILLPFWCRQRGRQKCSLRVIQRGST